MIDLSRALAYMGFENLSIARAEDGSEEEPWPGIGDDPGKMQAALDGLVTWPEGVVPPTAAAVIAAVPAAQQAVATAELAAIKLGAQQAVDERAELARQRFITPGAGQALVYEQKRNEAERWQGIVATGGTPLPAEFPIMKARAERLGVNLQAVADEWTARSTAWIAVAAAIENIREGAKEAIAAAETPAAIAAILQGLSWPAPA